MIPICLVTGFLGSGKTTFLRHIIDLHGDEKIVYLVNEFSSLDVDGDILRSDEDDVVAVPGGSIFCRCLVTEFAGRLREIPRRFGSDDEPIQSVVIEASGVANPMVVEQMLAETGLNEIYDLGRIVSIVDPGSLPKLIHTLPNIRSQIEAADVVLVNKIDLFDEQQVAETERIVREIAPEAEIVRTIRSRANVNLLAEGSKRGREGDYALCADPNFARFALHFSAPVEIDALQSALEDAADCIYRAKGVVPTHDGDRYVDMSATGLLIQESDRGAARGIAIIARAEEPEKVKRLVERFGRPDES